MSDSEDFKHLIKAPVRLVQSGESGIVTGRAQYLAGENQYRVSYVAADGRQVESWFDSWAIQAAPAEFSE